MNEIVDLPISQITPGPNDRKDFDAVALQELADSIKANGLAQPITVRPVALLTGTVFEIVAGERRWRAVQLLGLPTIPAIVKELDDEAASSIMLVENTSRADLNPIEEARAYSARIERFGWSVERVAQTAGRSVELIARRVSLLQLVPEAQALVASKNLPIGHAEAMTALDSNRQRMALRIYNEGNLPLVAFRQVVSELLEEQSQDALFDITTFWMDQAAQAELPRRGKHAVTGAPVRPDLPAPRIELYDTTGAIIDRYIADLLKAGLSAEAGVLGTVYNALVRRNHIAVPSSSELAQVAA